MTIDARGGQVGRPWGQQAAGATPAPLGMEPRYVGLVVIGVVVGLMAILVTIGSLFGRPSANAGGPSAAPADLTATGARATIAEQVQADPDKFMTLQRMATEQLDAILKDPDSARFKDAVAVAPPAAHGSVFFCGLVNAKSGFGAYTGYTRFIVAPHTGAWLSNSRGIRFHEVWRRTCQDSYVIGKAEFVN